MTQLSQTELALPRCPHCNIADPFMPLASHFMAGSTNGGQKLWVTYRCSSCSGAVLAHAEGWDYVISLLFPSPPAPVSEVIPDRARHHLTEAIKTKDSPSASCISSASAVDAMLKSKGLITGSLFTRIDQATTQHLITPEMAVWAHEVRLDANDERHADLESPLPVVNDAQKSIDFALAIAEYLFVLPNKVERRVSY
jgi:hypothetical protein